MPVPLARRTLLYDWRRFLPAALAIAFSGLLVLVQMGLLIGLFSTITVYVTASAADLWAGFPGTQAVDTGRPIRAGTEVFLQLHPAVARVEKMQWSGGDWRAPRGDRGGLSLIVIGIDTRDDGMALAYAVTPEQRRALREPGGILIDRADLSKLGATLGDTAEIGGRRVRVVGITNGLRAVGAVNVIASLETFAGLDRTDRPADDVAYFLIGLKPGASSEAAARDLASPRSDRTFDVWAADDFADRTQRYWILESGLGVGVVFASVIALTVGIAIASQTLSAAIAGSIREFATLRALGVPACGLRRVVLAQSLWLSAAGLLLAGALGAAVLALARFYDVPVQVDTRMTALAALLVLGVALASGLLALRQLRQADPAILLR